MNVSVKIVTLLKAIIEKTIHIITYPLKIVFGILRKILFRPISFICINLRSFFKKSIKNLKKLQKTTKTEQTKREF